MKFYEFVVIKMAGIWVLFSASPMLLMPQRNMQMSGLNSSLKLRLTSMMLP